MDNPSEVRTLLVSSGNPYLSMAVDDNGKGASFTVAKRIDTDRGLSRLQILVIDCITQSGVRLEVGTHTHISSKAVIF